MGQVLARGCGVPPEQGRGGGVAKVAAQTVHEGVHASAEVSAWPVDGFAECQEEARLVGDVPAIQLVHVSGLSALVLEPAAQLADDHCGGSCTSRRPGRRQSCR